MGAKANKLFVPESKKMYRSQDVKFLENNFYDKLGEDE